MKVLPVSAAALAAGWLAAPFVVMSRRGTLDEQHSGELDLEAIRVEAERQASARASETGRGA